MKPPEQTAGEGSFRDSGGIGRRDPLAVLAEVLESIWLESDESDIEFLWLHRLRTAPGWVAEAERAFERVIASPPTDLCSFIERHSGRAVGSDGLMYGDLTCVEWLAAEFERVRSLPR